MEIALLMKHNSYPGREYMHALINKKINFDVISIGNYPSDNKVEDERCNRLWKPKDFDQLLKEGLLECFRFASWKDIDLTNLLNNKKYDIGVQGGTGILKGDILDKFKIGILNFHPGDLPYYRGASAPEWQVYENKPVISTCHLIDDGIDSGPIYSKKELDVDYSDYFKMRATVYPKTAEFMTDVLIEIIENQGLKRPLLKQHESMAIYRKYIGEEKIKKIKQMLVRKYLNENRTNKL